MGLGSSCVGLWNADLLFSVKGFYGIGFAMSLSTVVAVQKYITDRAAHRTLYPGQHVQPRPGFLDKPEF